MLKLLKSSTYSKRLIGTLEITTKLPCPNKCSVCPQSKLSKAYKGEKVLSLENYKKINEKIPTNIRIDFSGMGEPFTNKNCADMIVEAYKTNHEVCVYTTAVGMTLEDVQKIKDLKFDTFMLHLPDDKYFILKKTEAYEKVISLLRSEIPNLQTMKLGKNIISTRGGSLSSMPHQVWNTGPITCKVLFYKNKFNHNILLPNCDVVICCMDYGLEYPMGNLLEIEYESLFTSDAHKRMLKQSFTKEECFICRKCECGKLRFGNLPYRLTRLNQKM